MTRVLLLLLVVVGTTIGPALAVQPDERLADHALEERARTLSRELRCMVCQNQSIDDSDAPLARDLRLLVRERLKAGDSDQQILDFLVSRYGEFVLLKPSFAWHNLVLWGAPFLVLLIGAGVAFGAARRQRSASSPLSADEERALRELTGPR